MVVRSQHWVLVPGFFGFANLGRFEYFAHVERAISERTARLGWPGRIVTVDQHPTASLLRRAARLAEVMAALVEEDDGDLHVIGHSTGGIDARLVLAPGARLPTQAPLERIVPRVRTLVSVSAPHHGAPLAIHWGGRAGREFLKLFSLANASILDRGGIEGKLLDRLFGYLAWGTHALAGGGLLDEASSELLSHLTPEARRAVDVFFGDVESDMSLLDDLTPSTMALVDALAVAPPPVREGAVVSWVPSATPRDGFDDAFVGRGLASHAVFGWMSAHAGGPDAPRVSMKREVEDHLRRALGVLPEPGDNDGFVPTLSQLHGELVHATRADHVDTIGHYYDPRAEPPHYDWFESRAGFGRAQFEALWDDVVQFVARGHEAKNAE
jgi:triacylglycerol lipase